MTYIKLCSLFTSIIVSIAGMHCASAYESGSDHEKMEQLRQKLQQDVQQMKSDQQKLSQDREKVREDRMEMMRLHQDMMRDRMEREGGQGRNNPSQRPQQGGTHGSTSMTPAASTGSTGGNTTEQ